MGNIWGEVLRGVRAFARGKSEFLQKGLRGFLSEVWGEGDGE